MTQEPGTRSAPLAVVTGFGAFVGVDDNPSGRIVEELEREPPLEVTLRTRVLPVTFEGSKRELDALLAGLPTPPAVLLGLGAHRQGWFRLERRARPVLDSEKPDNDGVFARSVPPLGERELETPFELERCAPCLSASGLGPVQLSDGAGGFVCERVYHALLEAAEALGSRALFLHVPPAEFLAPREQARHVRELLRLLVSDVAARRAGPRRG